MSPTLHPLRRRDERCHETRDRLSDYIDGELSPDDRAAVERHLHWCPGCRRVLAGLSRTVTGLRRLGERQQSREQTADR